MSQMKDRFDIALRALAGLLILFMVVSLFYLYVAAGRTWNLVVEALFSERVAQAVVVSISSSTLVGLIAVAAVIPTAYVLTYKEFRFKGLLETLLIEFPQTFPPATVGLVYLLMLGPGSPINIAYTYSAVIVSKLYVAAPFAMSLILRRFGEIHRTGLDTIARTLGSRTRHLLLWVLLPLSVKDLAAGFSLTWARAMGEVAGTLIFAGAIPGLTETIPAVVLTNADPNKPEEALAVSVIAAFLSIGALLFFKWIARER